MEAILLSLLGQISLCVWLGGVAQQSKSVLRKKSGMATVIADIELFSQLIAARDLGADVAFIEGLREPDDIRLAVKTLQPMPASPSPFSLVYPAWIQRLTGCTTSSDAPRTQQQMSTLHYHSTDILWRKTCYLLGSLSQCRLSCLRSSLSALKETGKDEAQGTGVRPKDFLMCSGWIGKLHWIVLPVGKPSKTIHESYSSG